MGEKSTHGIVGVGDDNWSFIDSETGTPVTPFGVNYLDPDTGWPPQFWSEFDPERVDEHLALVAEHGGNVVRVFGTAGAFFNGPNRIDDETLEKLDTLVTIASRHGLRVLLTGPDHWEGWPSFWATDEAEPIGGCLDPKTMDALETYWSTLADRYADDGTIFGWDLLNEPTMNWDSPALDDLWQEWLADEYGDDSALADAWGGLPDGESIADSTVSIPPDEPNENDQKLYDYQRFREWAAQHWTERQARAIREAGDEHLVTIGYVQWSYPAVQEGGPDEAADPSSYAAFNPAVLDDLLDFHCPHFYPLAGDPADPASKPANAAYLSEYLRYCYTDSPVVLGEFGWYGGGKPDGLPERDQRVQDGWNRYLVETSRGICGGWFNWPLFDMSDSTDISQFSGIVTSTGEEKRWGESFREYAWELTGEQAPKSPEIEPLRFDEQRRRRLLTGRDEIERFV